MRGGIEADLRDALERAHAGERPRLLKEAAHHLPAVYAENPSLLEGFLRQREVIQSQFRSPEAGVVEITFGGATSVPVALQKPCSRGTVVINDTNPDPAIPPLIDFNAGSNPVDMLLATLALRKAREFMSADGVAPLEPQVDAVLGRLCQLLSEKFGGDDAPGPAFCFGDWALYCKSCPAVSKCNMKPWLTRNRTRRQLGCRGQDHLEPARRLHGAWLRL